MAGLFFKQKPQRSWFLDSLINVRNRTHQLELNDFLGIRVQQQSDCQGPNDV